MKPSYILFIITFICSFAHAQIYTVTTFAGARAGYRNDTGTKALFNGPEALATDLNGNIYVADLQNHVIRKINPEGVVSTFAGSGIAGYADGIGSAASFYYPHGVAVDAEGYLYVTDSFNYRIRKVSPTGEVTTFAGSGGSYHVDGTGTSASFSSPWGIAIDDAGYLYVTDYGNHCIRKISPFGAVTTIAGIPFRTGSINGSSNEATFNKPKGIAIDNQKNLFIADDYNLIRKVSLDGLVTTLAGSKSPGYQDGIGTSSSFNYPFGLTVDSIGNVYVADASNNRIRKISPSGVVSTIAGSGANSNIDGVGTQSSFSSPRGIAFGKNGKLYIGNWNTIRAITFTCNTPPAPTISSIRPVVFCEGDETILEAPESYSYRWSTGETSRRITVRNNSVVRLIIFNDYNCKSDTSDSVRIVVHPVPPIPIITAITDTILCKGDTFILKAPISAHYLWSNGDTTQTIVLTKPTSVSLRVTNEFGCLSNASVTINLRNLLPDLATNNPWLCPEKFEGYIYTAKGQPNSTFNWETINGFITSNRNEQITVNWAPGFNISRNLSVTETTTKGCRNGPVSIVIRYDSLASIPKSGCVLDEKFAPVVENNVIIPNSDYPENRTLNIRNLFYYPNSDLKIYNRWGNLIKQITNYQNNLNIDDYPEGLYYYYFDSGRNHYLKGWVQVVK